MSFTLNLGFVGECLFVPEPATSPTHGTMHVLLPVVPATGMSEAFVGALCFDPAYQQAGSRTLTGGVAMLPMQRVSLALGNPQGSIDLSIPPEVARVGSVADRPIIPGLLGNDPPETLIARVDLRSGGITTTSDGADWAFPTCRRYTNSLIWQTEMDGHQLDLEFAAFPGPGGFRYSLYPVDGVLQVEVYCTPVSDLPPYVPTGDPPPFGTSLLTFLSYYQMFEPPVLLELLPTYCGTAQAAGPYTCMVAQSPLTPAQ